MLKYLDKPGLILQRSLFFQTREEEVKNSDSNDIRHNANRTNVTTKQMCCFVH